MAEVLNYLKKTELRDEKQRLIDQLSGSHRSKSKDPQVLCNSRFNDFTPDSPIFFDYQNIQLKLIKICRLLGEEWAFHC